MRGLKKKKNLKNYPGYENAEYSKLVEASMLESNNQLRFKMLEEAEKILSEDMPLTAIYHWKNTYLQKPNVKNLLIYPTGSFHLQEITFRSQE